VTNLHGIAVQGRKEALDGHRWRVVSTEEVIHFFEEQRKVVE
jgi:hypothetical protein